MVLSILQGWGGYARAEHCLTRVLVEHYFDYDPPSVFRGNTNHVSSVDIPVTAGKEAEVFDRLLYSTGEWLFKKGNRDSSWFPQLTVQSLKKNGTLASPIQEGASIEVRALRLQDDAVEPDGVAIRLRHPCASCATRSWEVDIGLTKTQGQIRVSMRTSYDYQKGSLAARDTDLKPNMPGLLRTILTAGVPIHSGGARVGFVPISVTESNAGQLLDAINDTNRHIPVLVVSRDFLARPPAKPVLDAKRVASNTPGAALVYVIETEAAQRVLQQSMPGHLVPTHGGARIFPVGLNLAHPNAGKVSPTISAADLSASTGDAIEAQVTRALLEMVSPKDRIRTLEDVTSLHRTLHHEMSKAKLERGELTEAALREELKEAKKELLSAQGAAKKHLLELAPIRNRLREKVVSETRERELGDQIRQLKNQLEDSENRARRVQYDLEETRERLVAARQNKEPSNLPELRKAMANMERVRKNVAQSSFETAELHRKIELLTRENAELHKKIRSTQETVDAGERDRSDYVKALEEEVAALEKVKTSAEEKALESELKVEALTHELKDLQGKLRDIKHAGPASTGPSVRPPKNNVEALERVSSAYPDRIIVGDRVWKTAKKASSQDGEKAFEMLEAVASDLWETIFIDHKRGRDMANEFRLRTTFELTPVESEATMGNAEFRKAREFVYKGKAHHVEAHVKYGGTNRKAIRLYYLVDQEEQKIVITHFGDHLPSISGY